MTWEAAAACRGMDPAIFFPVSERTDPNADYRPALAICEDCTVTAECLAYMRASGETKGVWGGTTPQQRKGREITSRRPDRRQVRGDAPADGDFDHGGYYGYSTRGCRCDVCRDGNAARSRLYWDRRRAKANN